MANRAGSICHRLSVSESVWQPPGCLVNGVQLSARLPRWQMNNHRLLEKQESMSVNKGLFAITMGEKEDGYWHQNGVYLKDDALWTIRKRVVRYLFFSSERE